MRPSLWFIPTLIVVGTVVLAVALIEVDSPGSRGQLAERWPRLFGAGAEGSRLLAEACDQIRQNAAGNVAVLARLHQVLVTVAGRTSDEQRHNALLQQAALVAQTAERSVPSAHDRATIQAAQAGYAGPGAAADGGA